MKKIFIGCFGVTALVVVAIVLGLWFWIARELPALEISLSIPPEIQMDTTVTMVVTATNVHKTPVTLDSVDIDDDLLAGFQVISITPKPTDTIHVPIVKQRSWEFGKSVLPGEAFTVTFEIRPVAEGHYSGSVDVCNPNQDFKTEYVDVVVRKQAPAKPSETNPQ